jgi:branched-chain amino acid transport system ATP-binding protein
MLLEVRDLYVHYGSIEAVKGITLRLDQGEIVVVIGANGAGKSTMLKAIIGLLVPSSGQVWLKGQEITGNKAYELTKMGISLIPEGRQVFPDLSVYENLLLGAYYRLRRREKQGVEKDIERYFDLFPILRERRDQLAGTLSGGEQQMFALARGLMSSPELLLMDEPSLGLAPKIARDIFDALKLLNKEGRTILLVEQLAWLGLGICDRGYVLENGRIVLEGTRKELLANSKVIEAYVGKKAR